MGTEFLSARQAAQELGITPATLYAYVSRGLIRSEEVPGTRTRRYRKEDVLGLKQRKEFRSDPAKATASTLNWGIPVLDSAITLIAGGQPHYRGQPAVQLATTRSVEEVAALIWLGDFGPLPAPEPLGRRKSRVADVSGRIADLAPFDRLQVLLPLAAAEDPAAFDLRPPAVLGTAARILRLLPAITTGDFSDRRGSPARARTEGGSAQGRPAGGQLADTLARAWAPGVAAARDLIGAALIVAADHELNVSAFAARCVASAGANPYAVVSAGLAALGGSKHGGHCDRVEALFEQAGSPAKAHACVAGRLRRGEPIPGCGQRLYPAGDPRGALLLDLAAGAFPGSPELALARSIAAALLDLMEERPSIDFGLVTLSRVLGLPAGGAITLFAIGRSIGWLGHAMEQYRLDSMIRPRARYVGPDPIDAR